MLAIDTPTDEAVYKALNAFNKKFVDLVHQVYVDPYHTPGAEFHGRLLGSFDTIVEEVRASEGASMAMCDLDAVQHAMLQGSTKWQVVWVKAFGTPIANPLPMLTSIVEACPVIFNVMVSRLKPGAELPLHKGPFKGVTRYHLGIEVPEGDVGLEVHGQPYRWRKGAGVTFDDTLWHRAWNRTPHDRVVLFADILRYLQPPLREERNALLERLTNSEGLAKIVGSIHQHTK